MEISNAQIEMEKTTTQKNINEISRKLHLLHAGMDPKRLKKILENERVGFAPCLFEHIQNRSAPCFFGHTQSPQPPFSVQCLSGILLLQMKMKDLELQQQSVKEQMQTYRKDLTFVNSLRKEFH